MKKCGLLSRLRRAMQSSSKTIKLGAAANVCSAWIAKNLEKICTSVKSFPATVGSWMVKEKNLKLISRSPAADLNNMKLHVQRPSRPFLACLINHCMHRLQEACHACEEMFHRLVANLKNLCPHCMKTEAGLQH